MKTKTGLAECPIGHEEMLSLASDHFASLTAECRTCIYASFVDAPVFRIVGVSRSTAIDKHMGSVSSRLAAAVQYDRKRTFSEYLPIGDFYVRMPNPPVPS